MNGPHYTYATSQGGQHGFTVLFQALTHTYAVNISAGGYKDRPEAVGASHRAYEAARAALDGAGLEPEGGGV